MKKTAVIFSSKYGTTQKYATWISEELGADLFDKASIKPSQISYYDIIIYGGGLYASGISGIKFILKNKPEKLIVFTVGLANPATTDFSAILKKNFDAALLNEIKVFHLRGGIDYKKISLIHKIMMAIRKKFALDKKIPEEYTDEEQLFLKTYGDKVDFTDRSTIRQLVDYIRSL
jgi:menaquinone-dependent protoporphyrinogen IX oxidase